MMTGSDMSYSVGESQQRKSAKAISPNASIAEVCNFSISEPQFSFPLKFVFLSRQGYKRTNSLDTNSLDRCKMLSVRKCNR